MKAGVAGAGIVGKLLAFSLKNSGWDVTLFDHGQENNCSQAAAGLLTPVSELEKNDDIIFHMGEDAIKTYWPTILGQLNHDIFFQQTGSLILSHPRDHSDLIQFIKIISSKLKNDNYYQKLNHDSIKNLEPAISTFSEGFYFSCEAQLDNQALLNALDKNLTENKITWYKNTIVSDIKPNKIIVSNETYLFDIVFDCRGLGAKKQFNDLRSIRGELIWLHANDVSITRPIRFIHPRYKLYIAPRPNQIYLIGASEIESEDYSPISVRTTLELLTACYCIHSNFSEARIIKTVTQCRPTLKNHLPKIKYGDHFIAINGLYRHGFLIAPTIVSDILQWIKYGMPSLRYPQLWEKMNDSNYIK